MARHESDVAQARAFAVMLNVELDELSSRIKSTQLDGNAARIVGNDEGVFRARTDLVALRKEADRVRALLANLVRRFPPTNQDDSNEHRPRATE